MKKSLGIVLFFKVNSSKLNSIDYNFIIIYVAKNR